MSGPLRIAIVVDPLTLSAKGGEHPARIASELLGRGHVVRGFGAPPGQIPRSQAEEGGEDEPSASRGLMRFRPDVVLAYDALSPAAALGARAARRLGGALVLVEADAPDGGRGWQRVLWRLGEILFRSYVRRSTHAVVALDPVARARAEREGYEPLRTSILPLGVDLAVFRPGLTSHLVSHHRVRGRVILYAGPLEPGRGVETLVAAFARTVGQRDDWALVLAGDGSERARLRATADRLGIGARVHWLGRPRREELPGLFGASTLLAVPATSDVVLGRNVARAMATGLPVIASDLPRLSYLVRADETGLLAAPGDVQAWADAIARAAGTPMGRARWSRNARKAAESRFAWPRIAEQLEAILVDALARARAVAPARKSA